MSVKFKNNVDVDGQVALNNLQFDTSPSTIPTDQGSVYWDTDDNVIAATLNGYIQKIGEDSFYQVKNQTGNAIPKGTAVRFNGTVGMSGRLLIAPFLADGSSQSSYFMGVTAETIADGGDGKVLWFGRIKGINTNAFNEGDILYASTSVAGGFQTTPPVAPNNIVQVAAVVSKSATNGTLFIRPTLGSNINKDEGVKIVSPATGQILQLQSNGLWENKTLSGAGIQPTLTDAVTGTGVSGQVSFWSGSGSQTTVQSGDNGLWWNNTTKRLGLNTTSPEERLHIHSGSILLSGQNANPMSVKLSVSGGSFDVDNYLDISAGGGVVARIGNSGATPEEAGMFLSGRLSLRASASTLPATQILVTTSNPLSTTTRVVTRTPSQLREDIGAQVAGSYVPTSRTLTINGTSFDLSANRSWTIPTHDAVTIGTANGLSLSGQQLSLGLASASTNGALSSTNWTTFNNKIEGSGTTNYLPKFTGTGTIGNSLVFDNGTNVGIGTTAPNFSAGGRTVLDINGSSQSLLALSVGGAARAFMFHTNTDLLISNEANGSIGFNANGDRRVTITPLGNVGIGTTSPEVALHIARAGEVALDLQDTLGQNYRFFSRNSDKTLGIFDVTNSRTFFRHVGNATVGSTRLSLMETGGNLFIGNTADQTGCLTQIQRTGSSRLLSLFNTTAQGGAKIEFFDGTSNGAVGNLGANLVFYINNRDTERMRITSAGNVGIGTTSPTEKLQVLGNVRLTGNNLITANTLSSEINNFNGSSNQFKSSSIKFLTGSFVDQGHITFNTSISGVDQERLRISETGNVGIGTTSPNVRLDINGASNSLVANFKRFDSYGELIRFQIDGVSETSSISIPTAGALSVNTNGSERLRITSAGNVGIGTTSPNSKLEIRDVNQSFDAYGNVNIFTTNSGVQNVGGSIALGGDSFGGTTPYPFAKIQGIKEGGGAWAGALILGTTQSNSAITEKMRITSSGNVGIGTTSPNSALHVARANNVAWIEDTSGASGATLLLFSAPGATPIGFISRVGTTNAVAYNTTSDYRLKEDLKEINGLDIVSKIKVYDFKWKDHTDRMDGVLAHELQEVLPYAVTGEKDGENMQAVDYSKIVPVLVASIQEQQKQIDELKEMVNKLINK
jgi:hypothetical protein